MNRSSSLVLVPVMGESWFTLRAAGVGMGVGVGVGVGALAAWWAWRRALTHPDTPTHWEEVGEVSQLIIYPLKSGRGVKVTEAEATRYGLAIDLLEDRSFVALEDTQVRRGRHDSLLVGVTLTLEGSEVTLQAKGVEEVLEFDLQDVVRRGEVIEVKDFRETLGKGYDCGEAAAAWLTKVLQKKREVRLAYNVDLTRERRTSGIVTKDEKKIYVYPGFRDYDRILYAEHAPYLLTSDTSLADINARMLQPVTQDWFRPNIIVSGVAKAYDEDDWAFVRVGDVVFRRIKPCDRYEFVDPESVWTSERDIGHILMRSLAQTRQMERPPILPERWKTRSVFGSHLGIDKGGRVRVGDKVAVARASHNPLWQL